MGGRSRVASPERLCRTARSNVNRYRDVYTALLRDRTYAAIVGGGNASVVRSAVRAAAVRTSVTRLYRDRLQNVSVWLGPPLSLLGAITAVLAILTASAPQFEWPVAIAAATVAWVLTATSLAVAVAVGWGRFHLIASAALVGAGGIYFAAWPEPPWLVAMLVAAGLVPGVMYAAFIPMVLAAYITALRLNRTVDPRARMVLDLLTSASMTASGTAWLRRADSRDRLATLLERVARTAERDLPRLLTRRTGDHFTEEWLAKLSRSVALRVREVKRQLLLPGVSAVEELRVDVARLLLMVCRGDWVEVGDERTAPPIRSFLRTFLGNVKLSLGLLACAALIHWLLVPTLGSGLTSVRDGLVVAAVLALIPLPYNEISRISDTFGELARP